jgi:uncharacterized protein YbaP (TraB family)
LVGGCLRVVSCGRRFVVVGVLHLHATGSGNVVLEGYPIY